MNNTPFTWIVKNGRRYKAWAKWGGYKDMGQGEVLVSIYQWNDRDNADKWAEQVKAEIKPIYYREI